MITIVISYNSNSEVSYFEDVKAFSELLKSFYSDTFILAESSVSGALENHPPHHSCQQNHCWHLPAPYAHTYTLKYRARNLADIYLLLDAYKGFCEIGKYDVEFSL